MYIFTPFFCINDMLLSICHSSRLQKQLHLALFLNVKYLLTSQLLGKFPNSVISKPSIITLLLDMNNLLVDISHLIYSFILYPTHVSLYLYDDIIIKHKKLSKRDEARKKSQKHKRIKLGEYVIITINGKQRNLSIIEKK